LSFAIAIPFLATTALSPGIPQMNPELTWMVGVF